MIEKIRLDNPNGDGMIQWVFDQLGATAEFRFPARVNVYKNPGDSPVFLSPKVSAAYFPFEATNQWSEFNK